MALLRRIAGKLLRAILSPRQLRLLRRPAVLPSYYRAFAHELEPLLDAQQGTAHNQTDPEYWKAMLRKYAHILDKGIQRADFQPGHSKTWHAAALQALSRLDEASLRDPSVAWAERVVEKYERKQTQPESDDNAPVETASADYQTLRGIIEGRRSVRRYSGRRIEGEKLERIADAVNWSPTSCNRQPAKIFVTIDPGLVSKCVATCAGATCFSGQGAGFLSFCADMRVYDLPEEVMTPDLDLGLGIQNCLLVAHTLGLSVTLLSWARHTVEDERELRDQLRIPWYYRIIVNGLIGYPAISSGTPARKPVTSTLSIQSSPTA